MGLVKGGFQRLFQTALYVILFLASAVILGFYSYFLAVLSDRSQPIPTWEKAVEGISGAACLYLIFASVLTCCLGGIAVLAFIAIVLDVLFAAAMIAVAVMTRHGADSCSGIVNTPIGTGPASATNGYGQGGFGDNTTYSVHLGLACKYNSAAFACSIICAILFLCTAAMQVLLVRHHKKEKRFGPSPNNNYTSGYGSKKSRFGMFGKKNKNRNSMKAAEAGTLSSPTNNRVSGETGYTGTTVGGPTYDSYAKEETAAYPARGAHSGYYTAPTGTATSNPYGYTNTPTYPTTATYNTHNTPATNY